MTEAEEIAALRERMRRQSAQIREMQVVLERKNRELDALHYVWCDGGCPEGVHRWNPDLITEELVVNAERQAKRLRRWYSTVKWRASSYSPPTYYGSCLPDAAAKTDLSVVRTSGSAATTPATRGGTERKTGWPWCRWTSRG